MPRARRSRSKFASQRALMRDSGTSERQIAFWKQHLEGAPERLDLPTDLPRTASRSRRAGVLAVELPATIGQALKNLAQQQGTTVFPLLLAAYAELLGRLTRQQGVVVGVPVAARTGKGDDGLVGFFVNTLALRLNRTGQCDTGALLGRIDVHTLAASWRGRADSMTIARQGY